MPASVGVVGVGAMGGPVTRRLLAKGVEVLACDTDPKNLQALEAGGVRTTTRAADCLACEIVLVLVATQSQVGAVLDALSSPEDHRRARPVVAIMSTIGPQAVMAFGEQGRAAGLRVVDAPISGGPGRAAAGTMSVMAAGAVADIEAIEPLLDLIAAHVIRCGDLGAAQTMKVLNNIVGNVNTLVTGDVYRLGLERGLTVAAMAEVLEQSTGRNWLTASGTEALQTFDQWSSTPEVFESLIGIIRKDFALAEQLVDDAAAGGHPMVRRALALSDLLGEDTRETWRQVAAGPPS